MSAGQHQFWSQEKAGEKVAPSGVSIFPGLTVAGTEELITCYRLTWPGVVSGVTTKLLRRKPASSAGLYTRMFAMLT